MSVRQPGVRDVLVACLPVMVAVLLQSPALRQKIRMSVAKGCRDLAVWQTLWWQERSLDAARWYDKTRM